MASETLARLILSAVLILGFGGVLIALLVWHPDTINNTIAATLGVLGTGYVQVIVYWFGPTAKSSP